jgi:hypothetical protein
LYLVFTVYHFIYPTWQTKPNGWSLTFTPVIWDVDFSLTSNAKKIRWKQDLNLRGETPSDDLEGSNPAPIQITRLNDSAIPALEIERQN